MSRHPHPWTTLLLVVTVSTAGGRVRGDDAIDLPLLDTVAVARALADPTWVVVDTRSPDAYNGWPLDGTTRGGHLPNAVDFAARWIDGASDEMLARLENVLGQKGITPDKHVVLYDVDGGERTQVAEYLAARGYQQTYGYSAHAWIRDAARPLDSFPGYSRLVPAEILAQRLAGKPTPTFPAEGKVKVVEVSWGDESASYGQGHVPGSFHVNTDAFEPPPQWMLGDPQTLTDFARKHGLAHDDAVVVTSAQPLAAFRLAMVLGYMGVRDVRVLHGGLAAWRRAGLPVETDRHDPPPACEFGRVIPARPAWIDDLEGVRAGLRDRSRFTLVDVRSRAEYEGKTSGYAYCPGAGRIPGAIFGFGGDHGVHSLDHYRNVDDTMRNGHEILRRWQEAGIDTATHVSFMCGSGWRAAEALCYAQVLGLPRASMYSNGWIEWSRDPHNPVLTDR